jgi:FkbM family methyltransferase
MSFLKKAFGSPVRFWQDQEQYLRYLLRCLRGRDLWVRPQKCCHKLRLGQGDGEWTICPDHLHERSLVYSFGLGSNISFDLALINRFHAEVHGFDPTPLSQEWLRRQELPQEFHFHSFGIGGTDGSVEFRLPAVHGGMNFTMSPHVSEKTIVTGQVLSLPSILDKLGHNQIDLLKMDVEGAEYEVIPDIIKNADRIAQLLIEFHHRLIGEKGLEQTRQALTALADAGFELFHVSPRGLEFSFLRE